MEQNICEIFRIRIISTPSTADDLPVIAITDLIQHIFRFKVVDDYVAGSFVIFVDYIKLTPDEIYVPE